MIITKQTKMETLHKKCVSEYEKCKNLEEYEIINDFKKAVNDIDYELHYDDDEIITMLDVITDLYDVELNLEGFIEEWEIDKYLSY